MKTKVEINNFEITIEDVDGNVKIIAEINDEVIEELNLDASEYSDDENEEEEEIKAFGEDEDEDDSEEEVETEDAEESDESEDEDDEEDDMNENLKTFDKFFDSKK